jgi:hypothetical protein
MSSISGTSPPRTGTDGTRARSVRRARRETGAAASAGRQRRAADAVISQWLIEQRDGNPVEPRPQT